jgi:uncharacterized Zn-finger protein
MPEGNALHPALPGGLPPETFHVDDRTVACDGGPQGGSTLGHPRVFLHIDDQEVVCPYCSRVYILKEGAGHGGH